MYATSVETVQDGFLETINQVMHNGSDVKVRGATTREIQTMVMNIKSPEKSIICYPHRNNNIFATVAETLWVLAGRNDIAFLSKYLPRAKDFSDDGLVWRAGYGQRLRNYKSEVDQLHETVRLLREDDSSRRAVMSIFDPTSDFEQSKDIPCTNWIHTMIRGFCIHTTVSVRSNDAMWGASGINWFEWSTLMKLYAAVLDKGIGEMNYLADSYHIYDYHFDRVLQMLERNADGFDDIYRLEYSPTLITTKTLPKFDSLLSMIMYNIMQDTFDWKVIEEIDDKFLRNCSHMLCAHRYGYDAVTVAHHINAMDFDSDLRIAAIECLSRKENWQEIMPKLNFSKIDKLFLSQFKISV